MRGAAVPLAFVAGLLIAGWVASLDRQQAVAKHVTALQVEQCRKGDRQ